MKIQVMTLQKRKQTLRESRKHTELVVNRNSLLLYRLNKFKLSKFQKTLPLFRSYDVFQTDVLRSGPNGTVRRGCIKTMQGKGRG